jgi:hypothetical protein
VIGPAGAAWRVPGPPGFPAQANVTLSARIADLTGTYSAPATLVVDLESPDAAGGTSGDLDPWDLPGTWVLDFSRNQYGITATGTSPVVVTSSLAQAPGSGADFLEDLDACGLQGSESAPGTSTVHNGALVGANRIVAAWVRQAVVERVRELYGQDPAGAPLSPETPPLVFVADTDPAAPALAGFSTTGSFSIMGVGGDPAEDPSGTSSTGVVGRAQFDRRNVTQNDDSVPGLGVFTTNIVRLGANDPPLASFRILLDPLLPGRGTPVGEDALDATVLAGTFQAATASGAERARYYEILDAVGYLGRLIGTKAAHEIGHSIGLVGNQAPPTGLFGDEPNAPFIADPALTNSAHIDVAGNNIMAAASTYADDAATGQLAPFFFDLARAYLGGGHLYDEGR